jgi:YVTN family beta-propeller protein
MDRSFLINLLERTMPRDDRTIRRAERAREFVALGAMFLLALAALAWPQAMAWPPEVGPFVYVTMSNSVAVMDAPTDKVVATAPVGNFPEHVAVTPDGKRAYVINAGSTVSVIARQPTKLWRRFIRK